MSEKLPHYLDPGLRAKYRFRVLATVNGEPDVEIIRETGVNADDVEAARAKVTKMFSRMYAWNHPDVQDPRVVEVVEEAS